MMTAPRVCVLHTDGTNCDRETAFAFGLAGAETRITHVNELTRGTARLEDFHILTIPGGFSYGDDVASGKILAIELMTRMREQLETFVDAGRPIIGICNGFQVLVRTGLLPSCSIGEQSVTLAHNDSGRFECRWVMLEPSPSACIWTAGIDAPIELPMAHGEGKFFAPPDILDNIEGGRLVPLRYTIGMRAQTLPNNPNGSINAIAGLCDPSGLIFGLMPHPERFVLATQHPNWRLFSRPEPNGLRIFKNAVDYVRQA